MPKYTFDEKQLEAVQLGQMQLAIIAAKHLEAMREEWLDALENNPLVKYFSEFFPRAVLLECGGEIYGQVEYLDDFLQFVPVDIKEIPVDPESKEGE